MENAYRRAKERLQRLVNDCPHLMDPKTGFCWPCMAGMVVEYEEALHAAPNGEEDPADAAARFRRAVLAGRVAQAMRQAEES